MWIKITRKFCNVYNKIYQSESIEQRIRYFASLDIPNQPIVHLQVKNPSFLNERRAKDILNFVEENKIPNNIRILHALAHIEYNAFMSYVDTLLRFNAEFDGQDQNQFLHDMREIALEEGNHFILLDQRLRKLGYSYGCMPVIPKLSLAIKDTQSSLIERIGVISLMHEGRGVKAVEKLIHQLDQIGDTLSVQTVKIIQQDQIKHFERGWKWFFKICSIKNVDLPKQINNINTRFKANIKLPQNIHKGLK